MHVHVLDEKKIGGKMKSEGKVEIGMGYDVVYIFPLRVGGKLQIK